MHLWGGSCRGGWGGVGHVEVGWCGVGHPVVQWVMQGWGGSCRGGVRWVM